MRSVLMNRRRTATATSARCSRSARPCSRRRCAAAGWRHRTRGRGRGRRAPSTVSPQARPQGAARLATDPDIEETALLGVEQLGPVRRDRPPVAGGDDVRRQHAAAGTRFHRQPCRRRPTAHELFRPVVVGPGVDGDQPAAAPGLAVAVAVAVDRDEGDLDPQIDLDRDPRLVAHVFGADSVRADRGAVAQHREITGRGQGGAGRKRSDDGRCGEG